MRPLSTRPGSPPSAQHSTTSAPSVAASRATQNPWPPACRCTSARSEPGSIVTVSSGDGANTAIRASCGFETTDGRCGSWRCDDAGGASRRLRDDLTHRLNQRRHRGDRVAGLEAARRAVVVGRRGRRPPIRGVAPPRRPTAGWTASGSFSRPHASHARSSAAEPSMRTRKLSCANRASTARCTRFSSSDPTPTLKSATPMIASCKAGTSKIVIGLPFRYAPSPCRAMKRSPRNGASTIPSTGSPATANDSEIVHNGLPLAKLIVPSIGSSTQRARAESASPSPSSPRSEMFGVASASVALIADSTCRSTSVA
jgi:hypothetical protein